ncbi:MAG: metallophosphoesterase family protein, partial [Planctomycetota bacterium]
YLPEELGNVYPVVDKEKAIINIGSVGQPRDKDNRASYVYVEENEINFVRMEYDIAATMKKIMAIEQLDDFQAERLREGR